MCGSQILIDLSGVILLLLWHQPKSPSGILLAAGLPGRPHVAPLTSLVPRWKVWRAELSRTTLPVHVAPLPPHILSAAGTPQLRGTSHGSSRLRDTQIGTGCPLKGLSQKWHAITSNVLSQPKQRPILFQEGENRPHLSRGEVSKNVGASLTATVHF